MGRKRRRRSAAGRAEKKQKHPTGRAEAILVERGVRRQRDHSETDASPEASPKQKFKKANNTIVINVKEEEAAQAMASEAQNVRSSGNRRRLRGKQLPLPHNNTEG